jgi:hypothetical protein
MNSLLDIVEDLIAKPLKTDSRINLLHPLDTLRSNMKIKLSDGDLKESVVIALYIITHQFLSKITNELSYLSIFH